MKLSTSTLGCFKWDLPTTLRNVKAYGYDGIDFRGMEGTLQLWKHPAFGPAARDETAARIRDVGLAVSCLSSGIRLTDTKPAALAGFDEELDRSAELCAALACRQIRVFGGALSAMAEGAAGTRARAVDRVAERAAALAERARRIAPVDILIETHDDWTHSADIVAALSAIDRPDVACCWDVKHTYWTACEVPHTTWGRIKPWVRNTHWKDVRRRIPKSLESDTDVQKRVAGAGLLCPVGEGVAPLRDALSLLEADGYDGWYTLEWEKRWHPHIEEPDVAFPGFVERMRAWESAENRA